MPGGGDRRRLRSVRTACRSTSLTTGGTWRRSMTRASCTGRSSGRRVEQTRSGELAGDALLPSGGARSGRGVFVHDSLCGMCMNLVCDLVH